MSKDHNEVNQSSLHPVSRTCGSPKLRADPMQAQTRLRLTYLNVAVMVVLLTLAGSAIVAKSLIESRPPAAAGGTWFLAGCSTDLPNCTNCEVSLPVSGTSSFGSTQNPANDQLSPNVTIVASNLSVHVEVAPGGSASRMFVLFARGDVSHSLKCTITGSNTTCDSGTQTLTIPPGSRLLVDGIDFRGAATKMQLSWQATPQ